MNPFLKRLIVIMKYLHDYFKKKNIISTFAGLQTEKMSMLYK